MLSFHGPGTAAVVGGRTVKAIRWNGVTSGRGDAYAERGLAAR